MAAVPRIAVVRDSACGGTRRLIGGSQREYDRRRPAATAAKGLFASAGGTEA